VAATSVFGAQISALEDPSTINGWIAPHSLAGQER